MFDPEAAKAKKDTAALKKKAFENIKSWIMAALPEDMKSEVETVATREFQCGDPSCAPIDTAIQIFFKDQQRKPLQTGLPKEADKLTQADVESAVDMLLTPPPEVYDHRSHMWSEKAAEALGRLKLFCLPLSHLSHFNARGCIV